MKNYNVKDIKNSCFISIFSTFIFLYPNFLIEKVNSKEGNILNTKCPSLTIKKITYITFDKIDKSKFINLNNINKILFLLILSSCTITSIDNVEDKKIEEEVETQEYFKKSEVIISPLDDYNIELNVMEKFVIDERIKGNNIHHSNLPIPSVVKLSDPSNLDNNIIVRNIK